MVDPRHHLIRALLDDAGSAAVLAHATSRPWASVTFVGEQHRLRLILPPDTADRIARDLPEQDFIIPGHFVADIAAVARHAADDAVELTIEALTIEDH